MEITPDKRLFWFLKDGVRLDLSDPSQLDMYVQQVITCGKAEDIKILFKNVNFMHFKQIFIRLKHFLPFEIRKFWEDAIGDTQ
jgi:hypothetical protein